MTAETAVETGADHILVATGASWLRSLAGRHFAAPIPFDDGCDVLTPDDLMAGKRPQARQAVLFDDDHYYMGGVLAELLAREDYAVTLVTPAAVASAYTKASLEQKAIQTRLLKLGVKIIANQAVAGISPDHVTLSCVFSGAETQLAAGATVLVTARRPEDGLWQALVQQGVAASRTGDCYGPGTIAAAIHAGRRFAEDFGLPPRDFLDLPFRREVTALS
jgi:dimethylamine/trimethylamine dehydrogenase